MRKSNHEAIRKLLRGTDGASCSELEQQIGVDSGNLVRSLRSMPDAYIDRWQPARNGSKRFVAVWCVVDVPEDCPHPEAP